MKRMFEGIEQRKRIQSRPREVVNKAYVSWLLGAPHLSWAIRVTIR